MFRLLADVHAGGHLAAVVRVCRSPAWLEFWNDARAETFTLGDFGLKDAVDDSELWEFCQAEQLLLVTNNRNDDGPTSLEAAIRTRGTLDSLPVITLGNLAALRRYRDYRERAAIRLLEVLTDLDSFRGTGRIYLPEKPQT